jgi:signal transduction histidine kinase
MYRPHWDEAAFIDFTKLLGEKGSITTGEKFMVENRPGDLYLHFLPFQQGMLYVGNIKALTNEHLSLAQALAEAFSSAYLRYEDFNKLEFAKIQIEKTLVDLKQAQSQLVQSEKMASLGELTAGIAHEIQNPLNFVNNFSEVNIELIEELTAERAKPESERDAMLESEILENIKQNLDKINNHGKRADGIVKGMLQHSRSSTGQKELTDINALADEYLRLAYHGYRAKEKSFNAKLETDFGKDIEKINVVPQDVGRTLLNLFNNAFYAVNEKRKTEGAGYEAAIRIATSRSDHQVTISIGDNGNGIPGNIVDKIFQPFFTTKPTGSGTGLGLSLTYDIIKAHGGDLKVVTKEGEGTDFIIQLPAF